MSRLQYLVVPVLAVVGLSACAVEDSRRAPRVPPPQTLRERPLPPPPGLPAPAWRARKVTPDAVAVPGGRLHTVKRGETGIAIARAYGVEWRRVIETNRLSPPYVLQIGDKLLLPSAREVATMSPEARARAFTLDIDDVITGDGPAETPRAVPSAVPSAVPRAMPSGVPPRPPVPAASAQAGSPVPRLPGTVPLPPATAPQFDWPVTGRILSGFGAKPGGRFNDGVNLKASAGAPVRAAADGTVAYAGDGIPGFGNLLLIKHADGYVTAYAHNQALLVDRGSRVTRGDVVARAGATGAVTEPQVHFEVRRDRQPIDPTRIITSR